MECVTSNGIYSGWFRKCRKLKNTCIGYIDPLDRVSKENNNVELGEEENYGDEAITVISATFKYYF